MLARFFAIAILPALLLGAPAKKPNIGSGQGENQDLALTVRLYHDPADIKELIGDDLGGHYIVAQITVTPKYGKEIAIDRDDFTLRTDKDGEKAKPFAASQIAGREALIVTDTGAQHRSGISLGGMGGGLGSSPGTKEVDLKVTTQNPAAVKENPLEKVLKDRILVEAKISQPASGLLYYPMEKQKLKDLELLYGPKDNRISVRFQAK